MLLDALPPQFKAHSQNGVNEGVLSQAIGTKTESNGKTAAHASHALKELLAPLLLAIVLVALLGDAILHKFGSLLALLDNVQTVVEQLASHARRQKLALGSQIRVNHALVNLIEGLLLGMYGVKRRPIGATKLLGQKNSPLHTGHRAIGAWG